MKLKSWILKAVVQKFISIFPANYKINYLFQRFVTGGVLLNDQHFKDKLQHAVDHIRYFKRFGDSSFEQSTCLELGSGWYPIVPVMLWLSGMKQIVSFDIYPWMNKDSVVQTLHKFMDFRRSSDKENTLFLQMEMHIQPRLWNKLEQLAMESKHLQFEEICRELRLTLKLQDARKTGFPSYSIQYICSNNTFEHVHKEVLEDILSEFIRVISPGGIMSHFIDMSDHFAHFDEDISIYNFLKFSEKKWKRIDNDIQPQNRLRFPQYLEMYEQCGVDVTDTEVRSGDLMELETVHIHKDFEKYKQEDLSISHAYIISMAPLLGVQG